MSSIDQAFLRAFDADGAPALGAPQQPPAPHTAAFVNPPAEAAASEESSRWFAEAASAVSVEPPQPHFVTDTVGALHAAIEVATATDQAVAQPPETPAEAEQWRPLSSYTRAADAPSSIGPQPEQREADRLVTTAPPKVEARREPFRAALEVDGLYWPEPVQELTTRHKSLLADAVTGLANLAVAHQKFFGIVGGNQGVGGTTIAACLARLLASSGRRVALVDADFGSAGLAETLGVAAERGWDESLRTGMPLSECAVNALADGVTLVPLRGAGAIDARALDALQTSVLANVLRQGFDAVIADMGCPFSGGQSMLAPLLAARAGLDASVVVTAPGSDHRRAVEAATDLLATPCLGYIENQRRP